MPWPTVTCLRVRFAAGGGSEEAPAIRGNVDGKTTPAGRAKDVGVAFLIFVMGFASTLKERNERTVRRAMLRRDMLNRLWSEVEVR